MLCKICGASVSQIFSAEVLLKYTAHYFHCSKCGFIQTSEPVWLDEAYKNPINLEDIGLLKRNILFAKRTSTLLFFLFNRKARYLDFAGGYGLFVRLMRDIGFEFNWEDPYTDNIFAKGFEYKREDKVELITTFESFEHFTDPLSEIKKMLSISENILFSTELYKNSPPTPADWDYYAFSHGQHIALYSQQTLKFIADKFKINFYTNGKSFHLLTPRKLNNSMYNILLTGSLLGFDKVVKLMMKSKTEEDSKLISGSTKK